MQYKLQVCYLSWVQIKFVVRGPIITAETAAAPPSPPALWKRTPGKHN